MPREKLLSKLKKSVLGDQVDDFGDIAEMDDDDGLDIESGIIHIDDSETEQLLSTTDVLRESTDTSEASLVRGHGGKVYVLDLRPFFTAIHATPDSKLGQNLISFSENVLARMIGRRGTYTLHKDETFFFRLKVTEEEGWAEATKIVNDIGSHFLRDSYKAEEFEALVLGLVDSEDAMDENGNFNFDLALESKTGLSKDTAELAEGGPDWKPIGEDADEIDWSGKWEQKAHQSRPAGVRVQRGPDRRGTQGRIQFADRRKRSYGRRDSDDPNKSVW
jgi:hypothetical protein